MADWHLHESRTGVKTPVRQKTDRYMHESAPRHAYKKALFLVKTHSSRLFRHLSVASLCPTQTLSPLLRQLFGAFDRVFLLTRIQKEERGA